MENHELLIMVKGILENLNYQIIEIGKIIGEFVIESMDKDMAIITKISESLKIFNTENPIWFFVLFIVGMYIVYRLSKVFVRLIKEGINHLIKIIAIYLIHPFVLIVKLIRRRSMKEYLGVVEVPVNKAGLVYKKRGKGTNSSVSISNEAGYQAELLPMGTYHGYWKWKYDVTFINPIEIAHDEIALVVAKDGQKNKTNIALGKVVECNDFQDAKSFITNGGEQGRQLSFLTEGKYFINPELFDVITKKSARNYDLSPYQLGKIYIKADEIGIVIAKYGEKPTSDTLLGKSVECDNFQNPQLFINNDGEQGKQLQILTEGEYGINPFLFEIITKNNTEIYKISPSKLSKVVINADEIGLVIAKYGKPIKSDINLGKIVECNDFQNSELFFKNGGERGKQLQILTEGEYSINPFVFDVITKENAKEHGLRPEQLKKYKVDRNKVSIVNILVGKEASFNDILKVEKHIHNSYQNPKAFFDNGGYRGSQEEVITFGEYTINPWFAELKQVDIVEIPTGTVGVVISDKGKNPMEGEEIGEGYKGIWSKPLPVGKYPLNMEYKRIFLLPTSEISLEWSSSENKDDDNYDIELEPINLGTKDGYNIILKIAQTICIRPEEAPKLILKMSANDSGNNLNKEYENGKYPAVKNLISKKIKMMVESHFKNIGHTYKAVEFRDKQAEITETALEEIRDKLDNYGVSAESFSMIIKEFPTEIDKELQKIEKENNKRVLMEEEEKTEKQEESRNKNKLNHDMEMDKIKAKGKAEVEKIEIETDTKRKEAEVEISKKEAEIKVATKESIIRVYGSDNYLEMKRMESLAKMKFPEYGGDISGLVLAQFFNSETKEKFSGNDEDFMEKLSKVAMTKNLLGSSSFRSKP